MKKKTYKVLFADDEYWTREKMRSMIPWETYDLDFRSSGRWGGCVGKDK